MNNDTEEAAMLYAESQRMFWHKTKLYENNVGSSLGFSMGSRNVTLREIVAFEDGWTDQQCEERMARSIRELVAEAIRLRDTP